MTQKISRDMREIREEISEMKHHNESDHEVIAKAILTEQKATQSHVEKTTNFEEFFAAEVERHKRMILDHEERISRNTADIQKQNEQIYKMENRLAQAEEDINYFTCQIENLHKFAEFLEEQRAKCAPGTAEWHKWNNKLLTNDGKIYSFTTRMNKARFAADEARRKLEVA